VELEVGPCQEKVNMCGVVRMGSICAVFWRFVLEQKVIRGETSGVDPLTISGSPPCYHGMGKCYSLRGDVGSFR